MILNISIIFIHKAYENTVKHLTNGEEESYDVFIYQAVAMIAIKNLSKIYKHRTQVPCKR